LWELETNSLPLGDAEFPTGNLFEPETNELTSLGQVYAEYINGN
jgi:hypothetical protein